MGIKFYCPNGHKLHVKSFLAGKRGVCPKCEARVDIPLESQIPPSRKRNEDGPATEIATSAVASAATGLGLEKASMNGGAVSTLTPPEPLASGSENMLADPVSAPSGPLSAPSNRAGVPATSPASPSVPVATAAHVQPAVPVQPSAHTVATPGPTPAAAPATPMTDPTSDAPHAIWYVRPRTGGQYGPANGETMRKWIGEGRVAGDSMVWREDWQDWQTAGDVLPQLKSPSNSDPLATASVGSTELAKPASSRSRPAKKSQGFNVILTVVLLTTACVGLLITLFVVLSRS